ncbi:MAG: CatB-related O-acetyltransferase [Actinomycetota bacterium]
MFGRPTVRHSRAHPSGVRIGSFCAIADDVLFIVGREHHSDWITTYPIRNYLMRREDRSDGPFDKGDINVGSDVWIGYRATILSGVSIGNGAVVAAGSVVTKDVSPYTIVGGNPARQIRRRFSEQQIEALERIAWWDWPDEKIFEHSDVLCSPDVDDFIVRFAATDNEVDS